MKIAIVRSRYTPFGGAERFVERALAALVADGAEITLIARSWAGAPAVGFKQLVCDPPYSRLFGGRAARDKSFARCVQQAIAGGAYDIVQSHERIPGAMVFRAGDGVHAAWLARRAATLSAPARLAQKLSPYHRYVLAAERAMFAHPALRAVICNSHLVRDEIVDYYGVAADKLVVIENGVDLERFHPERAAAHRAALRQSLAIPATAPVFLYVGNGFARKGVPRLLDAFAGMQNKAARLLIVGGDRKLAAAQAQAAKLGIAERVTFTGPQPEVLAYYGAADAFVLPTLYDPFPNAALEAFACGLPVLTSSGCGAAERISEGRNGYVVEALDVAALTARLDDLAMPGAAAAMREAARAAVADLSLERLAQRLTELYRRLAAG